MNTQDARKYAAEQGIAQEEALKEGMEAKAKELVEKGAEVQRSDFARSPKSEPNDQTR